MADFEMVSFRRALQLFDKGNLFVMGPKNLNYSNYENDKVKVSKFDGRNFTSVRNHNKFLMSEQFYSRFQDFDYVLYYQLDAFVFDEDIDRWCNLGYDYIGGPWLDTEFHYGNRVLWNSKANIPKVMDLTVKRLLSKKEHLPGNGGLSLRKTSSFLSVLERIPKIRDNWDYRNEDVFWSFVVPNNIEFFKVAPFDTALKFAFDMDPKRCFELNNNQIPYGCHAWQRPENIGFWRPIIDTYTEINF
jgi:hypothetical protein